MSETTDKEKDAKKAESREKSNANLIPFEKGKSGNPSGRPKGSKNKKTVLKQLNEIDINYILGDNPAINALRKEFPDLFPKEDEKLTAETIIGIRLIRDAIMKRNPIQYIKEFYDRIEGRPLQS